MKIMTLNTHSLVEKNYAEKLQQFVHGVLEEMPDVIALQEVNQTIAAPLADEVLLTGYVPAQTAVPVRADNHAANAARLLREAGVPCSWTYLPIKVGYGKYDEGLAMLVLERRISHVESFLISRADDYANWKTRKVLGMQVEGLTDWFYTVHMGWWEDEQEPFLAQWKVLNAFVTTKPRHAPVWLMGDFNSPAEVRCEGYDKIAATKRPKHRTPEATLLFISVLGGSVAMYITMQVIRHKTKHAKFMIGIPVIMLLQIAAVVAALVLL